MGTPAFGQFARPLFRWPLGEGEQLRETGLDREVAGGPDVLAPLSEQQVDLRRPAADALDPDELGDRFLVVAGQRLQVEFAPMNQLAQAARIALLLARQPAGAQRVEIARQAASAGAKSAPSSASSLPQTEAAAATETCWPTIVRSKVM